MNNSDPGIMLRSELMDNFGDMYGGERDVYDVLGYKKEILAEDYRAKFERQDIARRIVELPAIDGWQKPPEIDGSSELESQIDTLVHEQRLWHYCKRLDIVSGIGEYGLLFLGVADGQEFDVPLEDGALNGPEDIEYFTPFPQDQVEEWHLGKDLDADPTDERYNKPIIYEIDFSDVDGDTQDHDIRDVHWTRVIHVAEDLVDSDLKGTPRLKPVYNRLDDLEKVVGSSAEMYWAGADRKFQFNIDSDNAADIPSDQLEQMDEEVQKLVHDMQHYVKTFNTDIEVLGGEEPDPEGIKDVLLSMIAASTGIPKRILEGSERGELASSQDRANWFGTVESRQTTFNGPMIVRPLIGRLQEKGGLADADFDINWPTLFELTDLEKADVMKVRAQAIKAASPQQNTDMMFGSTDALLKFVVNGELTEEAANRIESLNEADHEVQDEFEILYDR